MEIVALTLEYLKNYFHCFLLDFSAFQLYVFNFGIQHY